MQCSNQIPVQILLHACSVINTRVTCRIIQLLLSLLRLIYDAVKYDLSDDWHATNIDAISTSWFKDAWN